MGIVTLTAWVSLYGDHFSPYRLMEQTGLSFSEVIERDGTILSTGRHKGQIAPNGYVTTEATPLTENELVDDQFVILLEELYRKIGNQLDEVGIERVEVSLLVNYTGMGQHDYGLKSKRLGVIGQLGADLSISYADPI